jgi:excisionase family DNA binding protein
VRANDNTYVEPNERRKPYAQLGQTKLLTVREVSERLTVSTETVLRWTRHGKLPGFRLPGGALRYDELGLIDWLVERGTPGPEELVHERQRPIDELSRAQQAKQGDRHARHPARPGVQAQLW